MTHSRPSPGTALSLYFISNREGQNDIWVAQRASTAESWGRSGETRPNVNSPYDDCAPALSLDGHWLFLGSNRPGGQGGSDLWVSWRAHTNDDFGWGLAANLAGGINTAGKELAPGPFENDDAGIPLLYFVSNRARGHGGLDIYVSQLGANGMYGPGVVVAELSTPSFDFRPSVRYDGLEMVVGSNRPGALAGSQDLWVSTRNTVSDPWSAPVNLGPTVNSAFNDNFGYYLQTVVRSSSTPTGQFRMVVEGRISTSLRARRRTSDDHGPPVLALTAASRAVHRLLFARPVGFWDHPVRRAITRR
jgi:hypothetical protein